MDADPRGDLLLGVARDVREVDDLGFENLGRQIEWLAGVLDARGYPEVGAPGWCRRSRRSRR